MPHRLGIMIVVLALLPLAAALAVASGHAVEPQSVDRHGPVPLATSDARTAGLISIPFLVFGLLVAMVYRHCVTVYQRWHSRRGGLAERPRRAPGFGGR